MQEQLQPDSVYHIYNHANGSENLFRSDENYHYFLRKYGEYIYPITDTFAYCLMPNHFHVMVKIRSEQELMKFFRERKVDNKVQDLQGFKNLGGLLSLQFSHFFNGYTKAYNKMYDRKGSLFMPNFKRKLISNDVYFTQLIVYIHLNPIKHGFCKNVFDWQHSSIHAYLHNKPSKLNREYLAEWFDDKNNLLAFHQNLTIEELSLI